jgi:hypothetical protein
MISSCRGPRLCKHKAPSAASHCMHETSHSFWNVTHCLACCTIQNGGSISFLAWQGGDCAVTPHQSLVCCRRQCISTSDIVLIIHGPMGLLSCSPTNPASLLHSMQAAANRLLCGRQGLLSRAELWKEGRVASMNHCGSYCTQSSLLPLQSRYGCL